MELRSAETAAPFGRNPFRFFFAPGGRPSMVRLLILLAAFNLAAAAVTWFDGTFTNQGDMIGLTGDVFHFTLNGAILIIFWLVRRVVSHTLEFLQFVPNMVITDAHQGRIERLARQGIDAITLAPARWGARTFYWAVVLFFLGLAVVFSVYLPMTGNAVKSWALMPYEEPTGFIFALFWATFVWPIVLAAFAYYLLVSGFYVLRIVRLLDDEGEIALSPVSPDGMGGLSVVGDIVLVAGVISAAIGFASLAWVQQFGSVETVAVAALIYLPAVIVIFGVPIFNLSTVIRRSRRKQLDHLTRLIQANFPTQRDQTLALVPAEQITDPQEIARLEFYGNLVNLYRRFEDLSVWPIGPVRGVLTVVAYVSPVAQILLDFSGTDSSIFQFIESFWN